MLAKITSMISDIKFTLIGCLSIFGIIGFILSIIHLINWLITKGIILVAYKLFNINCTEFTNIKTDTATGTFFLNNKEGLKSRTINSISRTFGSADRASGTFININ